MAFLLSFGILPQIRSGNQNRGTRGVAKSYPDYYGGAYVENGKLILLTPFEDLKDNDYESLLGKANYEVRKCRYSYNELVAVKNTILDYVVKCRGAVSSNIQSCSISGFENKVVVYLYDCLDGSIALFRNEVIDSDVVEFRQAGGEIVEASYPMAPGTEIQVNEGEGSGGSVGYRAKYTKYGKTVYGFVTCAHVVNAGATVKYNGSNVGVSDKDRWVHSGLDATFCSFSSDRYELSNLIGATGKNLSVATGFVAAETSVSKYGRTTFESTGIVKSESTFYTINGVEFTDVVCVENMEADYGDSGGIVYDSIASQGDLDWANKYEIPGILFDYDMNPLRGGHDIDLKHKTIVFGDYKQRPSFGFNVKTGEYVDIK